ncbi:MAG: hypothetical protein P8008_04005 [Gammaproteobacteria bacterium]
MKWLENNPFGVALAGVAGVLVLVSVGLGLWWSRPVDGDPGAAAAEEGAAPSATAVAWKLGPEADYDVINDRPLFNESRRPEEIVAPVEETPEEQLAQAGVTDPPEVRLTGVVITPEGRYVSLTPKKGGEPLVLRQGAALEGEYEGWNVDGIDPRVVRLQSARGQSFEIELDVHDKPIKEPPKPAPQAPSEQSDQSEGDDERLSRAEEIRQRIAERREQLRAEAEEAEAEKEEAAAASRNSYQDAIRSMIQPNRNKKDDSESGDD